MKKLIFFLVIKTKYSGLHVGSNPSLMLVTNMDINAIVGYLQPPPFFMEIIVFTYREPTCTARALHAQNHLTWA